MKRIIIMILAISLLVILIAWFGAKSQTYKGTAKIPNLVPEVSKFGTLTNLKDEKGRRLFNKPIQEGFYVRYRVNKGKEHIIYAIGDRVSDPKAPCSACQKISGARLTTQDGLNVTSGFVFDKSKETLRVTRTIANLSTEKVTMYLSEVKNYVDTNLLLLHTKIGEQRTQVFKDDNCWPCVPWPDCDLGSSIADPTKATIVCINCENNASGIVHVVCLADLENAIAEYKEQGCEHMIVNTGIDASGGGAFYDEECAYPQARNISPSRGGMPATGQERYETDLKRFLTLPERAAIVLTTEYKINLHKK